MKNDTSESLGGKLRTDEERRFILWSIARANPKVAAGPYIDGSVPDYKQFIVPDILPPAAANRRRLTKDVEYYRKLILAKSTSIGILSGGLIGFNVGIVAAWESPTMVSKILTATFVTLLCMLLSVILAWTHVILKRADLYGRRHILCHIFRMLWCWQSGQNQVLHGSSVGRFTLHN